jgi:signal transduction histidine kinase/GAF domain-containing protein
MRRRESMANILLITHEEKTKESLGDLLRPEYLILTCDSEQKIDNLVPLVDLVIVDFSSLEWKGLDVIVRVKRYDDSTVILGVGRQVKKEIVQAARQRGLTEYIDLEKDFTFLSSVIREKVEKEMLISRMKEERISRQSFRPSPSSEKERTLSSEEWQFLEQMSRFLVHGYNLDELMQFFLGLLNRMFGITRLSLLLKDKIKKTYRIRACLGMTEEMKEYVQLYPQHGLVKFLAREGTVITSERILQTDFKTAHEIKQEMKLIQSNVVVPLSPQGKLIGILGLGPKITGEKMSAREIKQVFLFCNQVGLGIQNILFHEETCYQKKYIENVLRDATSGVISADTEQRITTCNPRAQKMLNLDEYKNLAGKDIRKIPSPLGDLLFETLTQGTLYERKEVYIPAIKRWLGVSTNQVKNAKGKISGSMMIFTDLTPIKYLQEEKEKAQKRDFLAQVAVHLSHELRNSLVPIKSLAELLPSKYLDKEFQKRLYTGVMREIERIDNLIERLLFFSQPLYLDKVAESLPGLITEALEKTKKKTSKNREVQLNINCKEENLQIYADKKAIIEAFGHIVTNSIEAVAEEVAKIDISCEATDKLPETLPVRTRKKIVSQEPTEYVKIEIKDNGSGLPEKNVDKNKIFDPFFTTKNRGVGLGLTISQSIIEEHGGGIVPLSEQGRGTTMVVYLPRYRPPL